MMVRSMNGTILAPVVKAGSRVLKIIIDKFWLLNGDGGVGMFDVGGGACLHFWFKSSNFLATRLISVRNS